MSKRYAFQCFYNALDAALVKDSRLRERLVSISNEVSRLKATDFPDTKSRENFQTLMSRTRPASTDSGSTKQVVRRLKLDEVKDLLGVAFTLFTALARAK